MEKDYSTINLLFTRHGQTQDNIKGMICGQQPGVLTKMGVTQAKKIGVHLEKHPLHFDCIYVSDLGRTVATFDNIKSQAKYLEKIPTTFTKILRQKGGGVLEGKPLITWKQMADKQHKSVREYKCQKGQSWADVYSRCSNFVKLIIEEHIIKNKQPLNDKPIKIFAVAHGGVLMQFHNLINFLMQKKEPVFKNTAKNCSFHEFQIQYPTGQKQFNLQHVRIKCIRQNFIEHLKVAQ